MNIILITLEKQEILCYSSFGLIRRHRMAFEINFLEYLMAVNE